MCEEWFFACCALFFGLIGCYLAGQQSVDRCRRSWMHDWFVPIVFEWLSIDTRWRHSIAHQLDLFKCNFFFFTQAESEFFQVVKQSNDCWWSWRYDWIDGTLFERVSIDDHIVVEKSSEINNFRCHSTAFFCSYMFSFFFFFHVVGWKCVNEHWCCSTYDQFEQIILEWQSTDIHFTIEIAQQIDRAWCIYFLKKMHTFKTFFLVGR